MKDVPLTFEEFNGRKLIADTKPEDFTKEALYLSSVTYDIYLVLRWVLKRCRGTPAVCANDISHDCFWTNTDCVMGENARTGQEELVECYGDIFAQCRESRDHMIITEADVEVFEEGIQ